MAEKSLFSWYRAPATSVSCTPAPTESGFFFVHRSRIKERQAHTRMAIVGDRNGVRAERARRPSYLRSGLLKCGIRGGGVSKISAHHYGCSNARNHGTCDNLLTIRRDVVEESVLAGIKSRLIPEALSSDSPGRHGRT